MEFTPYTLPLLASATIAAALSLFALLYRDVPGRLTFALLMLAVTVWSAGYAAEISASDFATKVLWAKCQYFGIVAIPLLWLRFVVRFAGQAGWVSTRRAAALAIIPILTLVFVWFNESLGLIWRTVTLDESLGFSMLVFSYGPGLWMFAAYSYLLLLISALVLIRAIVWLPRLGSRQVTVVLTAALAPWAGNVLYLTGLNPYPLLDLTPFAFTFTGMVTVWGVGSFRFMGTLPVAHRAIIDGMRDGVIAVDPDNNVVEINAAAERLFDVKSEDVLGNQVWTAFDGHPEVVEWMTTGREANERARITVHGHEREFHIRILLLYDRRRNAGRLITFHDISQLALAERVAQEARSAAETANRSKSDFLANVSHEVRTPLNAILGMTDLTLQSDLDAQQRENLEIVRASGESLLAIINDILDLSKIEARKLILDATPFNLHETIGETIKMLSVSAATKGLALLHEIAPDVPVGVVGDPLRLRQVLFNLLSNAIKFTAEGEVRVSVARRESAPQDPPGAPRVRLSFEVADTGIGISTKDRARIFESFAQADASTTRLYGGTGLGLAIASHLIELMEGSIEVESELGEGSTFRFTALLEVAEAQAVAVAADAGAPSPSAAEARRELRILVAEDNAVNQRVARILLESRGHDVTIVGDGRDALDALGRATFDVVLMDVQMPNMDGIEATKAIRAGEKWTSNHIPIIAVTAHAMTGDEERFLEAGMDAYLPKPLEADRLFDTIYRIAADAAEVEADAAEVEASTAEAEASAPAAMTTLAAAPSRASVFDHDELLDRLVGDEDLLVEVVDLYLKEYPPVMAAIRTAVADRDAEATWKAAHRLKGSVGSLSARAAFEAARRLEEAGRAGELDNAAEALAVLEAEVERLAEELTPIVAG